MEKPFPVKIEILKDLFLNKVGEKAFEISGVTEPDLNNAFKHVTTALEMVGVQVGGPVNIEFSDLSAAQNVTEFCKNCAVALSRLSHDQQQQVDTLFGTIFYSIWVGMMLEYYRQDRLRSYDRGMEELTTSKLPC